MADNIRLITFSAQTVKAVNDANVYEAALGAGGVKYGCVVTAAASGNTIHITAGNGVLCGRAFEVFETDIPIQLSGSGTLQGRVYLHLDLSNVAEPIQIMTETGSSLTPTIQQEDVNVTNGIYEINLATFEVTPSRIENVQNVAKKMETLADKINELANEIGDRYTKDQTESLITLKTRWGYAMTLDGVGSGRIPVERRDLREVMVRWMGRETIIPISAYSNSSLIYFGVDAIINSDNESRNMYIYGHISDNIINITEVKLIIDTTPVSITAKQDIGIFYR